MRDGICMFALALCITLVYAPRAEAEEPILVNVVAQSVKPVVLEADPGTVSECHIVADGPGTVAICWDYLPGDGDDDEYPCDYPDGQSHGGLPVIASSRGMNGAETIRAGDDPVDRGGWEGHEFVTPIAV